MEYKHVRASSDKKLEAEANELGKQGWELVAVNAASLSGTTCYWTMTFKRAA